MKGEGRLECQQTSVYSLIHPPRSVLGTSSAKVTEWDIDCCLQLSGSRGEPRKEKKIKESKEKKAKESKEKGERKVTLSRLLNFIDDLWSTCGGDRRIIFTTNHVEKLGPRLIRKGRMVMHVELGHCEVEAFKVLAKNYLEVEAHPLFEKVRELLAAVKISSAAE
ncbi:hypothetical protein ZIOFF_002082 [Zingiber officinale]|uniref:ATPase AAA-type core domain-containing protein n=1 Tax=Zingiber officinale TaxID=94328 RepID=A0A8J5IKQ2_ZINOF|nr:hypothetical protein ZIOFF_002082 [Zingiber officinale]